MSNSDSPKDEKTGKRLTARQQLRNFLNGMLNEEGVPAKDRMTIKQRARWEEMRKALDESRIDEATAKDFMGRLRESLTPPDPEISDADIKRLQQKIKDTIEKSGYVARMEEKLAKEAQRKKTKYIN